MTTWQQRQSAHVEGCDLCQRQLAGPQPFHEDLCLTSIRPDDPRAELPPIQCPHLRRLSASMCERHLTDAVAGYRRMVARTAPLN